MTTKNTSLLSDILHDKLSSVISSGPEEMIDQALQATSTTRRPGDTTERNTVSPTHKRHKSETFEGNSKASDVEDDQVNVQMSPKHLHVDYGTKLYLKPPMEKPDDERRRRNAVTAWKNRVLKKKQNEALQEKFNTLEDINKQLHDANQRMEGELRAQREGMSREHNVLTNLQSNKSSLESLILVQQKKLNSIREHLLLINKCSDEDSPTQRCLTAVLNRMTSSSLPPFALPHPHHSSHHVTLPQLQVSPSPITSPPRNISSLPTTTSPHATMPPLAPIPKSPNAS